MLEVPWKLSALAPLAAASDHAGLVVDRNLRQGAYLNEWLSRVMLRNDMGDT